MCCQYRTFEYTLIFEVAKNKKGNIHRTVECVISVRYCYCFVIELKVQFAVAKQNCFA